MWYDRTYLVLCVSCCTEAVFFRWQANGSSICCAGTELTKRDPFRTFNGSVNGELSRHCIYLVLCGVSFYFFCIRRAYMIQTCVSFFSICRKAFKNTIAPIRNLAIQFFFARMIWNTKLSAWRKNPTCEFKSFFVRGQVNMPIPACELEMLWLCYKLHKVSCGWAITEFSRGFFIFLFLGQIRIKML